MKKVISYILIILLFLVTGLIVYSPRFGCLSFDKSCYYKRIMNIPLKTIILGGNEFKNDFRIDYGFMQKYLLDKLLKDTRDNLYLLLLYNQILNPKETKDFINLCIDTEANPYALTQCIDFYGRNEFNKEIVKEKLKKYENSSNELIKDAYKKAILN